MPQSPSEVSSFMQKERLASLATVDAEELPHTVSVFFTYYEGKVYIQTDRQSVKVRNLARNSNIAIAVYRGEEVVTIKGTGKVVMDRNMFTKRTQSARAYCLQLDEQGRDSIGIPLFDVKTRCVIEIIPDKILFW